MEAASGKLNDVGEENGDIGRDLNKKVTLPIVGVGVAAAKWEWILTSLWQI